MGKSTKQHMGKTFTLGDIHGRHMALVEVLLKSEFDYEKDKLIILGDIVDGGYNTDMVIEELLKIKNVVLLLGNHDEWFLNHIRSGWAQEIWLQQGGANTLRSYGAEVIEGSNMSEKSIIDERDLKIPYTHKLFLNKSKFFYIENKMLFVHGGINPKIPNIRSQSKECLLWDRNLIEWCRKGNFVKLYDKVFVGHTTTQGIMRDNNHCTPVKFCNLICMDCGAGNDGKLAIMDVNSEKFWVSSKQVGLI